MLQKDFKDIIFDIKNQISNTQVEIFQNANKSLLKLYYILGKILDENSTCGNNLMLRKSKGYEYYCSSYLYKKSCTSNVINLRYKLENYNDVF